MPGGRAGPVLSLYILAGLKVNLIADPGVMSLIPA